MSFANKVSSAAGNRSSMIETKEDLIALKGMVKRQVKFGTQAVTQETDINYSTGNLELILAAPIADRLPAFFEKQGIQFEWGKEQQARNASGRKTIIISDLESMRKLAVLGVQFDGAAELAEQAAQQRSAGASMAA